MIFAPGRCDEKIEMLSQACSDGDVHHVLLAAGADVKGLKAANKYENMPLHLATIKGQEAIVWLLAQTKTQPTRVDARRCTRP